MFSIKIITFVFVIHIRTFNTMKKSFISSGFLAALAASVLFASCKTINTVNDSHFDKKGYALDDKRLKELGGGDYWKDLLDRIRDIRSSEKVMYRQVLDLYATSVD